MSFPIFSGAFGRIAHNIQSIGEVQTKDAEPERFKSVANEAECDN